MTINNMVRNEMSPAMMRLASGQRINSAADDAAGLAIAEDMSAQIRGLDQGTRNTMDMQAMINTAEGGLDGVSDSLQRIRELSVQAGNGTLSASQREMIQEEIGQLAQGIQSAVEGTEFNTMSLLDGSVQGANTASSPDGTGAIVNINDMSSLAQAVTSFNVAGADFDISEIDAAISDVAGERANLGALSNRMDYTIGANTLSSLNLADSRSRIADADMAEEALNLEQDRVISNLQILMQQQEQQRVEEQGQQLLVAAGAVAQ